MKTARISPLPALPRRSATVRPRPVQAMRAAAHRTLIVGCGDVGLRILAGCQARRLRIVATCRRPEQAQRIRELGGLALQGDLGDPNFMRRLAALCGTGLIWLAPPPAAGMDDPFSRHMLCALAKRFGKRRHYTRSHRDPALSVCYVSTTGVYGDRAGQWTDESTPVRPANARAVRRVSAENAWRGRSAVPRLHTPLKAVSVLRAPGIYAGDRLPLDRLRAGTPAIMEAEDSWSNHIHAQDLARLSWRARFRQSGRRVFNAVDDAPTRMGDYFDTVAAHFGLTPPPRQPRLAVKALVSPMMWSFMSESRRIRNGRLRELGWALNFPSVAAFLASQQSGTQKPQ